MTFGAKLSFEKHIKQIYAKLKVLARIAPFINIQKKKVLIKAFFTAQFSYCLLIWIRKLNNKISILHERCLRIVQTDNTSSFEELLETNHFVSVQYRDIQVLATELYKIVNGLSPEIMKEICLFNENTTFNTRNKRKFHLSATKSVTLAFNAILSGT